MVLTRAQRAAAATPTPAIGGEEGEKKKLLHRTEAPPDKRLSPSSSSPTPLQKAQRKIEKEPSPEPLLSPPRPKGRPPRKDLKNKEENLLLLLHSPPPSPSPSLDEKKTGLSPREEGEGRRGRKQALKREDQEDERGADKRREIERKKKTGENKKEARQAKKDLTQNTKEDEEEQTYHTSSSSLHPEGKFAHPSTDLLSTAATIDSSSSSPPVIPSSSSGSFSSFFFFPSSLKSSSSSSRLLQTISPSDASSPLEKEKDSCTSNAVSASAHSLSVPKDVRFVPLSSSASSFPSFVSTLKRSSFFLSSLSSSSPLLSSSPSTRLADAIGRLQLHQFLLSYACYSSLYLTRKPFASARTKLLQELSLSTVDLGWIDTSFLFFYALVQLFLSSTVASFFSPKEKDTFSSASERGAPLRKEVTGLRSFFLLSFTLSSLSCLLISLLPLHLLHFSILLIAWGVNGASQALVFPFLVSILRQWLKRMKGGGASAFGKKEDSTQRKKAEKRGKE